jgi:hypothetical protein
MTNFLSRRLFLRASAGSLVVAMISHAKSSDTAPAVLDHLLLGCKDLDSGIAFVEERTGVRAVHGGAHPGVGTQNALLSLGQRHYLEIISPDPAQPDSRDPMPLALAKLAEPRLVGWAAHPGNLALFADKLRKNALPFEGPTAGSRKRPDARTLHWQVLHLKDDESGLLPFFIEWSADTTHPSVHSPVGCRLAHFELVTPQLDHLSKLVAMLALNVPITKGDSPQLRATLIGPKGQLALTS